MSVSQLIVSPVTKGLFKRAIIQSGVLYNSGPITSSELLKNNVVSARKLARDVGCHDDDQWLQCLKKMDVLEVLNDTIPNIGPVWGDEFLPKTAKIALQSGDFHHGIDLILGVTSGEESLLIGLFKGYPHMMDNTSITKAQFKEYLKRLIPDDHRINIDAAFKFYFDPIPESDQNGLRRVFSQILGDYVITCPSYFYAKDFASYASKDMTYFYHFTYHPEIPKLTLCSMPWMGVCHGEELQYVFGDPVVSPTTYSPTDVHFSETVMGL